MCTVTYPNYIEIQKSVEQVVTKWLCTKNIWSMAGEDVIQYNIQRSKCDFTKICGINDDHRYGNGGK